MNSFPIHFVYIDPVLNCDREWDAMCVAVPRVGEKILGMDAKGGHVVVRAVAYRFVKTEGSNMYQQVITVAVGDHDVDWEKYKVKSQ